jgi:hypothetical protein
VNVLGQRYECVTPICQNFIGKSNSGVVLKKLLLPLQEKFEISKQKQEAMRHKKIVSEAKKLGFELVPIKTA